MDCEREALQAGTQGEHDELQAVAGEQHREAEDQGGDGQDQAAQGTG